MAAKRRTEDSYVFQLGILAVVGYYSRQPCEIHLSSKLTARLSERDEGNNLVRWN
jgi:hypothetical protein